MPSHIVAQLRNVSNLSGAYQCGYEYALSVHAEGVGVVSNIHNNHTGNYDSTCHLYNHAPSWGLVRPLREYVLRICIARGQPTHLQALPFQYVYPKYPQCVIHKNRAHIKLDCTLGTIPIMSGSTAVPLAEQSPSRVLRFQVSRTDAPRSPASIHNGRQAVDAGRKGTIRVGMWHANEWCVNTHICHNVYLNAP
jgi:hypothetical protein